MRAHQTSATGSASASATSNAFRRLRAQYARQPSSTVFQCSRLSALSFVSGHLIERMARNNQLAIEALMTASQEWLQESRISGLDNYVIRSVV